MSKAKLHKCFSCFSGEKCGKKEKLSRRKKKILHEAWSIYKVVQPGSMWFFNITSCNQVSDYKDLLPIITRLDYFKKYMKSIFAVCQAANEIDVEEIQLDCYGKIWKLGFVWENDNGLYTESGVMPLQFGEDPSDGTWCWEETKGLCEHFGLDILKIKDERHFLKSVDKKINNVINKRTI